MSSQNKKLKRRTRLALAAIIAAHVGLALDISPGWIFAKYPGMVAGFRAGRIGSEKLTDVSPGYFLLNLFVPPNGLRWVQLGLSCLTILGVYFLARRAHPKAGLVAASALALAQPWLIYNAVLEPDLAIAFFNVAAMLCLTSTAPTPLLHILGGLSFGLSFALRPTALALAGLAMLWAAWQFKPWRPRRARAGLIWIATFAAGAVAPLIALHAAANHEWRSTMTAGQVLNQGHRPEGVGVGYTYPILLKLVDIATVAPDERTPDYAHELFRRFARIGSEKELTSSEAELYWLDKALAFAREEPAAFVSQIARKWFFTVAASGKDVDILTVRQVTQGRAFSGIASRWLALGGLAGLILCFRRGRVWSLLALWVAAYQIIFIVFFYETRYAVALLPAWACLVGCAVAKLFQTSWTSPRQALSAGMATLAPMLFLMPGFVRAQDRLDDRSTLVPAVSPLVQLRATGQWDIAETQFIEEQALFPDTLAPWSSRGYGLAASSPELAMKAAERSRERFGAATGADAFLLAALYRHAGRCDLALPLLDHAADEGFRSALEDTDVSLDPDLLASDCLLEQGQREAAHRRIHKSLEHWPGTIDGLARDVAAEQDLGGDPESAQAKLFRLHDAASAHYALARARRSWGDPAGGLTDAEWLREHVTSGIAIAELERSLCLLKLGRPGEALQAYAKTLSVPWYLYGSEQLNDLVQKMAQALPDNPTANRVALAHWMRVGDREAIRALLRRHPEYSTK